MYTSKMSYRLLYCAILLCGIILIRLRYMDYRAIRYNDYLRKFNKSYSETEFRRRLLYFEESLEEIQTLNSGPFSTGAVHALTKFSDWSKMEVSRKLLQKQNDCNTLSSRGSWGKESFRENLTVSEAFDWREQDGIIGPVDDQKQCNGCWAFSIVRNMESMAAIDKKGYDPLSVQQLLDCSSVNDGCIGGNIDMAMEYLYLHKYKLTTEDKYPLILVDEPCKQNPSKFEGRGIKRFKILCSVSDEVLMEKVRHGPVIVVLNPINWLSYSGGVVQRNCYSHSLRYVHAVQVVGFDTTTDENGEEIPYYIIKNTWGSDWGERGFIRVARGNKNLCGIRNHIGFLDVD